MRRPRFSSRPRPRSESRTFTDSLSLFRGPSSLLTNLSEAKVAKVVRVAIRAVTEVARLRRASAASCRSAATVWEGAGWKILPPAMRSHSWRLEAQVTYSVGGERSQVLASQLLRRPATWKGQGKVKQSCLRRAQPRLCMTDVAVVAFGPDERSLEQSHAMSFFRVLRRAVGI